MKKQELPFGSIEPLDREKMKKWLAEEGVVSVEVTPLTGNMEVMQRVGFKNPNFINLGVKKRYQKAPKR